MTIEIDFLQKKNIDSNPYDTDKMAAEFIQQFNNQAFSVGQQVGTTALTPPLCRQPNADVQDTALEELREGAFHRKSSIQIEGVSLLNL